MIWALEPFKKREIVFSIYRKLDLFPASFLHFMRNPARFVNFNPFWRRQFAARFIKQSRAEDL